MSLRNIAIFNYWTDVIHRQTSKLTSTLCNSFILHVEYSDWEFWFNYQKHPDDLIVQIAKAGSRVGTANEGSRPVPPENCRTFIFYRSGRVVERSLVEDESLDRGRYENDVPKQDSEFFSIVQSLFAEPYLAKLEKSIDLVTLPNIIAEDLPSIPAGSNPFDYDRVGTGSYINHDLLVMQNSQTPYELVLICSSTGKRVVIDISALCIKD